MLFNIFKKKDDSLVLELMKTIKAFDEDYKKLAQRYLDLSARNEKTQEKLIQVLTFIHHYMKATRCSDKTFVVLMQEHEICENITPL